MPRIVIKSKTPKVVKAEPTLGDLMKDNIPFGQCAYQAMSSYNKRFGAMCTSVLDYLFILFKNGTPSYPLGITKDMKGDDSDVRIKMFMDALNEYQDTHGEVSDAIISFVMLYFAHLGIPL